MASGFKIRPNPGSSVRSILPFVGSGSFRKSSPNEGWMDSPSGEFAYPSAPDRREGFHIGKRSKGTISRNEGKGGLTMYSQKSEFGKVMIAWNEYGPDPWGITGISYAAAILSLACDRREQTKSLVVCRRENSESVRGRSARSFAM